MILSLENVSCHYGQQLVLEGVSFSMEERDFLAVIGPNGGGKSTLIKAIMGLVPFSGNITLFGLPPKEGRKQVGYLSQYAQVDLQFPISVLDVVLMTRLKDKLVFFATQKDKDDAVAWLTKLGIAHLKHRPIAALSGGEKQRVFLARALMNNPKLLILDEPMASVDVHAEEGFNDLLKQLNNEVAILMISHDISSVVRMAKTVACLNRRLVYHGNAELTDHDLHHTYGCDVDLLAHGVSHRVLRAHD
ncbi:MAG: metal ABC transporter ATP-binding protein [Candidatus Margulisiibacteriota bacterium]